MFARSARRGARGATGPRRNLRNAPRPPLGRRPRNHTVSPSRTLLWPKPVVGGPDARGHAADAASRNSSFAGFLAVLGASIRAECDFNVEDVRKYGGPSSEMAPIVDPPAFDRTSPDQPELAGLWIVYKSQCGLCRRPLGQIRVMLLARQ